MSEVFLPDDPGFSPAQRARQARRAQEWRDGGGKIAITPVRRRGHGRLSRILAAHSAWMMHLAREGCARHDPASGGYLVGFERMRPTRRVHRIDQDFPAYDEYADVIDDVWLPVFICDSMPEVGIWDLEHFFLTYAKPRVDMVERESGDPAAPPYYDDSVFTPRVRVDNR